MQKAGFLMTRLKYYKIHTLSILLLIFFSGNEYHEYDVIYYADDLSSANNLSTSGATSGHASLIYQRQFRDVPDLSCLNGPGKKSI